MGTHTVCSHCCSPASPNPSIFQLPQQHHASARGNNPKGRGGTAAKDGASAAAKGQSRNTQLHTLRSVPLLHALFNPDVRDLRLLRCSFPSHTVLRPPVCQHCLCNDTLRWLRELVQLKTAPSELSPLRSGQTHKYQCQHRATWTRAHRCHCGTAPFALWLGNQHSACQLRPCRLPQRSTFV